MDTKLVEFDVDSSGEFGDVIGLLSCCVGAPLGLTNPICRLTGGFCRVSFLVISVMCAEVVLADFLWVGFPRTEVGLLTLARRGLGSCFEDEGKVLS